MQTDFQKKTNDDLLEFDSFAEDLEPSGDPLSHEGQDGEPLPSFEPVPDEVYQQAAKSIVGFVDLGTSVVFQKLLYNKVIKKPGHEAALASYDVKREQAITEITEEELKADQARDLFLAKCQEIKLKDQESEILASTLTPVLKKYNVQQMPVELVLLATVAMVFGPKVATIMK